ncbi:hypothetical protein MIMGU_mgv11b024638mg [Erythranthe guttata]|uniref:Uncharacterized protein n=1 Tax=Erythranthe guttata TaxID=4155 RepID=A0A022RI93_ERYGU|nr:hypothetical protein MIMGU_mgv11b024638mg [Erythranthe guttata]
MEYSISTRKTFKLKQMDETVKWSHIQDFIGYRRVDVCGTEDMCEIQFKFQMSNRCDGATQPRPSLHNPFRCVRQKRDRHILALNF